MGMSEPKDLSSGWYNDVALELYRNNYYDAEKTSLESKELIKERLSYFLSNPSKLISFYSEKIGSTWLNPTFQTIWCSLPGTRYRWYADYNAYLSYHQTSLSMIDSITGKLYRIEESYFNIYQIIIFIFAGIGIFKQIKILDLKYILLPIIFIGGFLFHILWETKAIYVIQYYFILLPYSAFGIEYIFCLIKNKLNKIKSLKEKSTN